MVVEGKSSFPFFLFSLFFFSSIFFLFLEGDCEGVSLCERLQYAYEVGIETFLLEPQADEQVGNNTRISPNKKNNILRYV